MENPYLATGATAECLALIFMIVAPYSASEVWWVSLPSRWAMGVTSDPVPSVKSKTAVVPAIDLFALYCKYGAKYPGLVGGRNI